MDLLQVGKTIRLRQFRHGVWLETRGVLVGDLEEMNDRDTSSMVRLVGINELRVGWKLVGI